MDKFIVRKGDDYTHTCLKDKRCYYIPIMNQNEFMDLYKTQYNSKETLCITEKHRDISPILIDFDFRQDTCDRHFDIHHIEAILTVIMDFLDEHVDVCEGTHIFILQKPPRKHKNNFKDGIHIIIPTIVTKPEYQHQMRKYTMPYISNIIKDCGFINSIDDIYDEAVIERNNWFMYGSKKPDEPIPWTVAHVYEWHMRSIKKIQNNYTDCELIELFSIRNKFDLTPIKKDVPERTVSVQSIPVQNMITNDQYVTSLVNILSPARADNLSLIHI